MLELSPQTTFTALCSRGTHYGTSSAVTLLTGNINSSSLLEIQDDNHRMDKRKSFVFARQYRNCYSRNINALVPRNEPIKTAVGRVMHDFHGLKTMTFHLVADIAYF